MKLTDKQTKQLEWASSGARPFFLIGFAGLLLYLQTLAFDFIFYDDNLLIANNYHFLSSLSNIPEAFLQGTWLMLHNQDAYYRPLLTISFMMDARGELAPLNYHFSNIFYHVAASCLFFSVLQKLGISRIYACCGALLFTVHPVLSQSVAWIGGRNDVLLSIFILASFLFFIRHMETKKISHLLFHLLFFAAGMLTKESAIVLPGVCMLYLYLFHRPFGKYALLFSSWAGVFLAWYLLRSSAVESLPGQLAPLVILKSLFYHSPALLIYTGKIIMPFNLSVMPVMQMTSYWYGAFSLLIIITGIWFCKKRQSRLIWLGFAWFLLFLLPSLLSSGASAQDNFVIREDRIYLPLMGAIIGLLALAPAEKTIKMPGIILAGIALVFCTFFFLTRQHSKNFNDRLSFWSAAAAHSPSYAFAHLHLGDALLAKEQFEEAIKEYRLTLELNPGEQVIHNNLGVLYLRKNLLNEAEQEFLNELKINPGYSSSYLNLGLVYSRQSRFPEAEQMWTTALSLNPDDITTYQNLIMLYLQQNNIGKAKPLIQTLQQKNISIPEDVLRAVGM